MTVRGHVKSGRLVVDEPTDLPEGTEVELVSIVDVHEVPVARSRLLELVATFPPGSRSKEDIDRQVAEDRAGRLPSTA